MLVLGDSLGARPSRELVEFQEVLRCQGMIHFTEYLR